MGDTMHMELSTFQSFVRANAAWFRGVKPESHASLERAESQLGFPLPVSLKWLLSEYGYSGACGVSSLDDAIVVTLRCRTAISFPKDGMILNDWGDAGVVCLDSRSGFVIWTHAHELQRHFGTGHTPLDADTFENFPTWVVSRLEIERAEE